MIRRARAQARAPRVHPMRSAGAALGADWCIRFNGVLCLLVCLGIVGQSSMKGTPIGVLSGLHEAAAGWRCEETRQPLLLWLSNAGVLQLVGGRSLAVVSLVFGATQALFFAVRAVHPAETSPGSAAFVLVWSVLSFLVVLADVAASLAAAAPPQRAHTDGVLEGREEAMADISAGSGDELHAIIK